MEEFRKPETITSDVSHSTAITLACECFGLGGITSKGVFSGCGNGFSDKDQPYPTPSRVCRPSEVPTAKSGMLPVGHGDEHHRDEDPGMRAGWVTREVIVSSRAGCAFTVCHVRYVHPEGHVYTSSVSSRFGSLLVAKMESPLGPLSIVALRTLVKVLVDGSRKD